MPTVALAFTLDRPVVTVQPFQFTGTPVRQITDLAGECAVALSRLRGVIVGTPRDARYLVRGNIKANEVGRMWVTVRLLDAASGRFLWADTWEGEREESFVFENRVAHRITAKLQAAIRNVEIERAFRKKPEELTAWCRWRPKPACIRRRMPAGSLLPALALAGGGASNGLLMLS
jgi:hypothetical protein